MDHLKIWTSGSILILAHIHHGDFLDNAFGGRNIPRIEFSLFLHTHKPILVKLWSRTCQPLDHCEIWTPPLEPICSHSHRCDLLNNVFAGRNDSRTLNGGYNLFSFSLTLVNPNRVKRWKTWGILGKLEES